MKWKNLLLMWVKEKQFAGDSVRESNICENVKSIYEQLVRDAPITKTEKQWSLKPAKVGSNHSKSVLVFSVSRHGESSSSETGAVETYRAEFCKVVKESNLAPHQTL